MQFHPEINDDELTSTIIGVAIEIHTKAGPDHPEKVYKKLMARGLEKEDLDCEVEYAVDVELFDVDCGTRRLDLFVEDEVVVELKALKSLQPEHLTQLGSYVQLVGASRGLLLNFGAPRLDIQRFSTPAWIKENTDS